MKTGTGNEEEILNCINEVRDGFMRVFIGIFMNYKNFINESKVNDANPEHYFNKKKFVENLSKEYQPFAKQFIQTQIFQRFLDKKANPLRTEDLLQTRFFDEKIIAKANKSFLSSSTVLSHFIFLAYSFYKR